jgi:hypothetical protein
MKFILVLLLTLVTTGCSWDKQLVIKNVLVTPDDSMLVECSVTPPPNRETYISSDMKGRESLLVKYSSSLMKDCFSCNEKIKALQTWKKESLQAVEQQNKENK